ncbi:hypothetical protein BJ742DRAFT_877937 [Cladochytrium replicatum]|nr:hypothetical protein BJ742DRAFT_877937 [Cladochytrium replicatum]
MHRSSNAKTKDWWMEVGRRGIGREANDQNGNERGRTLGRKKGLKKRINAATGDLKAATDVLFTESRDSEQQAEVNDVKTLRLLEWMARVNIDQLLATDRSRNPELWNQRVQQKEAVQNELNRLGCSLMAERLLTSDREATVGAALRLLIVLLDGGNKEVQNVLLSSWLSTREERFFYVVNEHIRLSMNLVRESVQENSAPEPIVTNDKFKKVLATRRMSLLLDADDLSDLSSAPQAVTRALKTDGDLSIVDNDYNLIKDVMRLIQLIVEGHNYEVQEYARHQADNVKSFDLVKVVVEYLHAIALVANGTNAPVIVQVFDTIIDLAQGCAGNQVAIFNAKIIQSVNFILRGVDSMKTMAPEVVAELKGKAVLSLLSLLEDDSDEETHHIFREMAATIDLETVIENLSEVHVATIKARKELSDGGATAGQTKQNILSTRLMECGFQLTMLIITLSTVLNSDQLAKIAACKAFRYFDKRTGRIEIVREQQHSGDKKNLYLVLFPIPEMCSYLRSDTKSKFLLEGKRDSPQDKVSDFIASSEDLIYEIRNQARVAGNDLLTLLASNYESWWKTAFAYVGFSSDASFAHRMCNSKAVYVIRHLVGALHSIFWLLSSLEFMVIQFPLILNRKRLQIREAAKERESNRRHAEDDELIEAESPQTKTLQRSLELNESNSWVRPMRYIIGALLDWQALYHIVMTILSIIAGTFHLPAIYSIHLLDWVYRDEVLQGVIRSVTLNRQSLQKTGLLGVIIIFIYSVVSFTFFRDQFDQERGLHCYSVGSCFVTVLTHGLRSGGGVGDLLEIPKGTTKMYIARVILDLSFFLVVIVFLLNVIFGIIFDTFGQLREEQQAVEEDLRNYCFICSIHASEFQRRTKGFEYHIRYEHNLWHYLAFLLHLKIKDPTEYTSHESFIAEKLAEQDLNWFPIDRALSLNRKEIGDALEDRVKALDDKVARLANIIEQAMIASKASLLNGNSRVHHPLQHTNSNLGVALERSSSDMGRNQTDPVSQQSTPGMAPAASAMRVLGQAATAAVRLRNASGASLYESGEAAKELPQLQQRFSLRVPVQRGKRGATEDPYRKAIQQSRAGLNEDDTADHQ